MMELETDRRNTRPPSAEEVVTFMQSQEPQHDPSNPEHVTRELMKPFPPSALFERQGLTYVQYQQVLRRLIHATGNHFDVTVLKRERWPWTPSNKGHEQALVIADVALTIPALQSTRTATGVQVVTVGFGEDFYKGAVSDGIKKAAQEFGVAIDLAGKDGEDTAPQQDAPQNRSTGSSRHETPRQGSGHHTPSGSAQRPNTDAGSFDAPQPGTGGPATKPQKGRLWHMSGKDDSVVAAWAAEYGETLDTLTKGTASLLIDTKGGE